MYIFSTPEREADPHAQPDIEIFETRYWDHADLDTDMGFFLDYTEYELACKLADLDPIPTAKRGWFYAFGMPGYLRDSEPAGPFPTCEEAIAEALAVHADTQDETE